MSEGLQQPEPSTPEVPRAPEVPRISEEPLELPRNGASGPAAAMLPEPPLAPSADEDGDQTLLLLQRWQVGDRTALDELLERDLPWIREQVSRRLGGLLRRKGEPDDFVNEAIVELLTYVPRFQVASRTLFRALLARVVENTLRDQHERYTAQRRNVQKERAFPTDVSAMPEPARGQVATPSQIFDASERQQWVRFATDLLPSLDREVVILRTRQHLSFLEIGRRLDVAPDAARMRFDRALIRLSDLVAQLRRGELKRLPEERPSDTLHK